MNHQSQPVGKYFFILLFFVVSCKKEQPATSYNTSGGTYFSIVQFAHDQFNTFGGQPYSFQKIVTLNGKTDSSFTSVAEIDWGSVLKPFFESDISDQKFLDQYNFSMFEDDVTDTRTFYYEAKDKKLFTQKLQIIADAFNDRITNIYVETERNGNVKKLLYTPLKLIQIQEFESPLIGKDKNLKVEYIFM